MITAVAVGLILLAVAYFMITTLADLHPLNNIGDSRPRERRQEVAINAPLMTTPAVLMMIAVDSGIPALGFVGATIELVIAVGGLVLWWLPYLTGRTVPWATAGTETSWTELHARTYATTIIVLPKIGDRPRPNLEHMILHSLLLAAAITAFVAAAAC